MHPFHRHEVDHQPTIDHGTPGHIVPAAPNGDLEAVLAGEVDGVNNVSGAPAACDQRRPLVDEPIVDFSCVLVTDLSRTDDLS